MIARELSPSSEKAYRRHFERFAEWCDNHGAKSMPTDAAIVKDYLMDGVEANGWAAQTLTVIRSALEWAHDQKGYELLLADNRDICNLCKNVRRRSKQGTGARPLEYAELQRLVNNADIAAKMEHNAEASLLGKRDGALFSLMWAGAFRRSEVVQLKLGDGYFREHEGGIMAFLLKDGSKGSQTAEEWVYAAAKVGVIDVRARLFAWIEAADKTPYMARRRKRRGGVIFPFGGVRINELLRERADLLGMFGLSSHSFRAGMITNASLNDVSLKAIQDHARHRQIGTTMRYIKQADRMGAAAKLAAAGA
ncbi:MAG: tyrosine-type recombinase/integrase [Pseudohongiellaceae bacterium]